MQLAWLRSRRYLMGRESFLHVENIVVNYLLPLHPVIYAANYRVVDTLGTLRSENEVLQS